MAKKQSAGLERKKFFSDPILVSMIVVLLIFLALFIVYPLLMLLVDSFYADGTITLNIFKRVLSLERFQRAFKNTLVSGVHYRDNFYDYWSFICLCRGLRKTSHETFKAAIWTGIDASCRIASICTVFIDDYVIWTKRHYYPFALGNL